MSMQVDRVDRQRIYWNGNYVNPNSVEYRLLEDEANQAVRIPSWVIDWDTHLSRPRIACYALFLDWDFHLCAGSA